MRRFVVFKKMNFHPFFEFEPPANPVESLYDLCDRLENSERALVIHPLSHETLRATWESRTLIPSNPSYGVQRATRLLKKHQDDPATIEKCCKVLAYLCGDCSRPQVRVNVLFEHEKIVEKETLSSYSVVLPDFSEGDVGCRLWGACLLQSMKFA